jgi:hypothetical protein
VPTQIEPDPEQPKGKVEVMMGTNSNEGGMMLSSGLNQVYPPLEGDPKPYTLDDLVEHAKE